MTTELQHIISNSIENKKSFQKISAKGIIIVSKKAWVARTSVIIFGLFLIANNIHIGMELDEPLLVYSNLLPIYGMLYLVVGWFFYRNPATGKARNDLVAVIVPVYNQKTMIDLVFSAIFSSSYKNLEVIAVNDGSTDGSKEILDGLKNKYCLLYTSDAADE